jgi:hypothetical protein
MHDGSHWGFGFGHWGLGVLFWIGVIVVIVLVIRSLK